MKSAVDNLQHLKFDKNHLWHQTLMCLYCTIIEYSDSLILLKEQKKDITIPLIVRSLFEAYIDFLNLISDRDYIFCLKVSELDEWIKITKIENIEANPFMSGFNDKPEIEKQIQEYIEQLEDLKSKGFNKMSYYDKFKKAGMENEYRSVYNFLCSYSHNNIRALIDRHLDWNEAEADFNITIYSSRPESLSHYFIELGYECLNKSSYEIHKVLKSGNEGIFNEPIN